MINRRTRRDAVAGGVWGLLVGDALGVPYEFRSPSQLPPFDRIEMPPPTDFRRSHPNAPPQAWSDDGAHALCLLASLLECGRLDVHDLGKRLLAWSDSGYMAVGGVVFDIGLQTREAVVALRLGVSAEASGPGHERNNGNGSLMRVLPLALWHRGTDEDLVQDAARQSLVTHSHPRSQLCCALYCLWVRATLQGTEDPWRVAVAKLREIAGSDEAWRAELTTHVCPEAEPRPSGSGYVVDCLYSARYASRELSFELSIKRAVSLGNDTDTTAAVTGGVVGVRDGLSSIPPRWLSALPGRELVEPLVAALVSHVEGGRG